MAPEPHSQTAGLLHNYCSYADGLTENIFPMTETEKLKSVPLAHNCSRTSRDFSSYFECKIYWTSRYFSWPTFLTFLPNQPQALVAERVYLGADFSYFSL